MPNRKLAELAQLAQLSSVLQAPQQQQQQRQDAVQQQRVAAALQLLGLQQEGERAGQMDAFRQQQLVQDQGQFDMNQQRLGQMHQDEVAHRDMEDWRATDTSQRDWNQQGIMEKDSVAKQDAQKRAEILSVFEAMSRNNDPRASSYLPQDLKDMDLARHQGEVDAGAANPDNQAMVAKLGGDLSMLGSTPSFMKLHPDVQAQLLEHWRRSQQSKPAAVSQPPTTTSVRPSAPGSLVGPPAPGSTDINNTVWQDTFDAQGRPTKIPMMKDPYIGLKEFLLKFAPPVSNY